MESPEDKILNQEVSETEDDTSNVVEVEGPKPEPEQATPDAAATNEPEAKDSEPEVSKDEPKPEEPSKEEKPSEESKPPEEPKASEEKPKEKKPPRKPRKVPGPEDSIVDYSHITVDNLSRRAIVDLIVKRHTLEVLKIEATQAKLKDEADELQPMVDELKGKRDAINEAVQTLKAERQTHHDNGKKLREQYFDLIEKNIDVTEHTKELKKHRRYVNDVDWKLQTSVIPIDKERDLVNEIKLSMDKMNDLSGDIMKQKGLETNIDDLKAQINHEFEAAQKAHEDMLAKAQESDVEHEEFSKLNKRYKECNRQLGRLKHKLENHQQSLEFWSKRLQEPFPDELEEPDVGMDVDLTPEDMVAGGEKKEEKKAEEKPEEPKVEEKPEEPKAEEKPEEPKVKEKPEEPKVKEKPEEPKVEEKPEEPKPEEKTAEPEDLKPEGGDE